MAAPPEFEDGSTTDELAEQLYWRLFRLMSALRRQEYDRIAAGSLTMTQCSVLYFLRDRRRARISDLAHAERVALPTMTKAVRRLRELGLVRRFRDASDQRNVWIEITESGDAAQREAVTEMRDMIMTTMTVTEMAALTDLLESLKELTAAAQPVPTSSDLLY
ncbi:MAG: MarR family winged helix-turn-helix transcriptional regulator [Mycobacterium sp.]